MEPSRFAVPQSSATCPRVFSWPDVLSELMGRKSKTHALLPVSQHAKPCKQKLSRLGGWAWLYATSVQWRTSREFCHQDVASVTDVLATQLFFSQPVSERAKLKSTEVPTSRTPSNQLVEGTPPCCALRCPSPAR